MRVGQWSHVRTGTRPDRRRSSAVPPRGARRGHRHARVRGVRRGGERRGGRRAGRRPRPRPGPDGHQPPGDQRHRGHPPDHRCASTRGRHAPLHLPALRPALRRQRLRGGAVQAQGGVRARRRARRVGAVRPFAGSVARRVTLPDARRLGQARSDLRRRSLAWLAVALVIGIAGGAAMAVAAAAIRTDTSYQRFLATHHPSDVSVTESTDFVNRALALGKVAALPEVDRSARASLLFFEGRTADGRRLTTDDLIPVAGPRSALGDTLDRWKLLEGRRYRPDAVDEAVLDYEVARDLGLHAGDTVTLRFVRRSVFNPEIAPYVAGLPARIAGKGRTGSIESLPFQDEPERRFRIVGIVTDPVTFPPTPGQLRPFLRLTPAFYERYVAQLTHSDVLFVDLDPVVDLAAFKADVAQISGGSPVFYGVTQADHEANVDRTLHLAAVVLWMLAGLIALATAVIAVQALSRQAYLESVEHPVLRALGMTRRERFATGLVRTAVVALGATVTAVAVAIALSPLWPIGLARVAEPSPGVDVDVAVIGAGALAVVAGVLLVGAAAAWRWTR